MKTKIIFIIAFLLFLCSNKAVFAQFYSFDPPSATKDIDEQFVVNININTESKEVKGGDAKITYDTSLLEVVSVEGGSFFGSPTIPKGGYNVDSGIIYISYGYDTPTAKNSGSGVFAKLTLKGKAAGTASLTWACSSQTNDSNIVDIATSDVIQCAKMSNGSYVITEGSENPEPTATPVPDNPPAATATPVIPVSGVTLPTVFGIGAGAILTILGLVIAL